jgi:hypothetical protein
LLSPGLRGFSEPGLKTAQAIGLEAPDEVLEAAYEIIR